MLTIAINVLFAFAGVLAIAVIARSVVDARDAYARLMLEGELMRAGIDLRAEVVAMRLRPAGLTAPRRTVATRRPATLQPLRACVAA